ncbi:MAG: Rieske 2Fe-2S domain-containing protein [Candidatus Marinimicrobia bacterium]|nr:Rieske 2Fe-2S domain-containing protein [Candidatus Neomarinimicrobiota bacterium]MCF7850576.1 Rieske 2Fe-2S domain-containing protein [Candidatus Neomarinimicrobiota bacterium]MCF7903690.1 Rieske 2Fe-2S domain-containing protein [Candidatus Neomarinimicrobiota bacterium]
MNDGFMLACSTQDIPKNEAKNVNLNGVEIAIFNTSNGFIAHSGHCKHNAFKLEHCVISGDIVRCPRHDWKYRISTGAGIKPSWTSLDNYPVEVRGDEIWVKPEVARSDENFDTSSYQW